MSKMLVVGDSHGDIDFMLSMVIRATDHGIKRIHQVGDFGIWPGQGGKRFLDMLDKFLESNGVHLTFTDGNHEDFDTLEEYQSIDSSGDGFVKIRRNIDWASRGTIWEEGGRTLMSMGGAASIDKEWRTEGKSWWPQEYITDSQVAYAIENFNQCASEIDVLFTHDAPSNVDLGPLLIHGLSDDNRTRLTKVIRAVEPELMIHGHYHRWLHYGFGRTEVVGLDANVGDWHKAYVVLDLDEMTWVLDV